MPLTLEKQIIQLQNQDDAKTRNEIIMAYEPFILNTIVQLKNAYIQIENDEEFSIGLMAFNEAIDKYDEARSSFLTFARVVIESRIKNYWEKESRHSADSLDANQNAKGQLMAIDNLEKTMILRQEIHRLETKLEVFGLDFNKLADAAPKHRNTKKSAIDVGIMAAKHDEIIQKLYLKKKLPILLVSQKTGASIKVVKTHKFFIIAVIVSIKENLTSIMEWFMIEN